MSDGVQKQRPTMKDVADRVGVSIKSVSRVLNGEGGVSPATTERILAVAREMDFRRNDLARNLRRQGRTETIGILTRHTSTRFHDQLVLGIDAVAAEHGALVLTAATRTAEREQSTLLALSSRRIDGLVVVPAGDDHQHFQKEQAAGLPMIFVDRLPIGFEADAVTADNQGGAHEATSHLTGAGHRRIALVGPDARLSTVAERIIGYRSAMAETSGAADELIRLGCTTSSVAQAVTEEVLRLPEPPTALFALSSVCTIGVARALRAAGLGHQVALVGFDDFEPADLLDPPITVVAQDPEVMGRYAARQLFSRIGGDQAPARTTVTPTRLIRRGSGEIKARPVGAH